jgi:hypothetical protein
MQSRLTAAPKIQRNSTSREQIRLRPVDCWKSTEAGLPDLIAWSNLSTQCALLAMLRGGGFLDRLCQTAALWRAEMFCGVIADMQRSQRSSDHPQRVASSERALSRIPAVDHFADIVVYDKFARSAAAAFAGGRNGWFCQQQIPANGLSIIPSSERLFLTKRSSSDARLVRRTDRSMDAALGDALRKQRTNNRTRDPMIRSGEECE